MKRIGLFLFFTILLTAAGFAQTVNEEAPFKPVSPTVMAQGGAFIAAAHGYDSLFVNPAGFAQEGGSLTLASTNFWAYMNPAAVLDISSSLNSGNITDFELIDTINDQITSGGLGFGFSVGAGLVTGGLGLGVSVISDNMLYGGRNVGDVELDSTLTVGFVGGYAMDMNLLGIDWTFGADLRPMYRIHGGVANDQALGMLSSVMSVDMNSIMDTLNTQGANVGWGVGIDLGAIATIGPLKAGLSIRDLFGTGFNYTNATYQDIMMNFMSDVAGTTNPDERYVIPMDISAGVAFDPDLGGLEVLFDPIFHADLQDVVGVFANGRSMWTLLHIGAEAKVLSLIKARAGFNQGYLTMGAGIHLLFLDVNLAFFTRELGQYISDRPNSGLTVEVALRL